MWARFLILFLCFFLFACSSDKVRIEGDRLSIIQAKDTLKPDFAPNSVKITLPEPYKNTVWSQKGGNLFHASQHLAAAEKLKGLWEAGFGEGASKRNFLLAEPVISEDVVFAMDADGIVSAFTLDGGERLWRRRLKPLNKEDKNAAMKGAGLAVAGPRLFATTGFGGVFAIDVKNGKILWRYDSETPVRIAPTASYDKVFVQTMDNVLIALDARNGTELWTHRINSEATVLVGGASPAYRPEQDLLVAGFSSGELVAFKASTGSVLWSDFLTAKKKINSISNINAIKASPVIIGGKVYAVGNDSILVAIDVRTGSRVWEREIGSVNMPCIAGAYLFLLSESNDLIAMDRNTGKIVWSINVPTATKLEDKTGVTVSGPLLVGNRLIVATSTGFAFAISPYDGKILGFITLDEGTELSPVVSNGTVIFTSADAELMAYR